MATKTIQVELMRIDRIIQHLERRLERLKLERAALLEQRLELDPLPDIDVLGLSVATRNGLWRAGITTVTQAIALLNQAPDRRPEIRNIGPGRMDELCTQLREHGYLA